MHCKFKANCLILLNDDVNQDALKIMASEKIYQLQELVSVATNLPMSYIFLWFRNSNFQVLYLPHRHWISTFRHGSKVDLILYNNDFSTSSIKMHGSKLPEDLQGA